MGHSDGDIAPKNIIVCDDGQDICLLDLFDMIEIGDGRIRTPAMCPDNCDALTDEQLDRYATTRIMRDLLTAAGDVGPCRRYRGARPRIGKATAGDA